MSRIATELGRIGLLIIVSALALQLYFLGRVALMQVADPRSTTFQRSEMWRLLREKGALRWHQTWVDAGQISPNLKRAVIASEDTGFAVHAGFDREAMERAWQKNMKAEQRTGQANARLERRAAAGASRSAGAPPLEAPVVGASTITQQLAKNLFLGSERTLIRKGQEAVITIMLEALLTKARILEIYLNNVEWGEGVFGAEAASRHYFGMSASTLGSLQAARLAVMLPAPKRFEKRPGSAYVSGRAAVIAARMGAVAVP